MSADDSLEDAGVTLDSLGLVTADDKTDEAFLSRIALPLLMVRVGAAVADVTNDSGLFLVISAAPLVLAINERTAMDDDPVILGDGHLGESIGVGDALPKENVKGNFVLAKVSPSSLPTKTCDRGDERAESTLPEEAGVHFRSR